MGSIFTQFILGSKTRILGRIRIGTGMSLLHHWLIANLEFKLFSNSLPL